MLRPLPADRRTPTGGTAAMCLRLLAAFLCACAASGHEAPVAPATSAARVVDGRRDVFADRIAYGARPQAPIEPYARLIIVKQSGSRMCGATVVGRRHLLTCAHCLDESLGIQEVQADIFDSTGRLGPPLQVSHWVLHNASTERWDIAVMELADDIPGFVFRSQAALAAPSYRQSIPVGTELLACGLGMTEDNSLPGEMLCASMPLADDAACAADGGNPTWWLCSVRNSTDGAPRAGDSGGPLLHDRGEASLSHPVLVGATSFGPPEDVGYAGIYGFVDCSAVLSFVAPLVPDLLIVNGTVNAPAIERFWGGDVLDDRGPGSVSIAAGCHDVGKLHQISAVVAYLWLLRVLP